MFAVQGNQKFPKGLTKDNIQSLYQQWQVMRNQGATEENNPEFAQISSILRMVQRAHYARMQQMRNQSSEFPDAENPNLRKQQDTLPTTGFNNLPEGKAGMQTLPGRPASNGPTPPNPGNGNVGLNNPSYMNSQASPNIMNAPLQRDTSVPPAPSMVHPHTNTNANSNNLKVFANQLSQQNTSNPTYHNAYDMTSMMKNGSRMNNSFPPTTPYPPANETTVNSSLPHSFASPSSTFEQPHTVQSRAPSVDTTSSSHSFSARNIPANVSMQQQMGRRGSIPVNPSTFSASSPPSGSMLASPYNGYQNDAASFAHSKLPSSANPNTPFNSTATVDVGAAGSHFPYPQPSNLDAINAKTYFQSSSNSPAPYVYRNNLPPSATPFQPSSSRSPSVDPNTVKSAQHIPRMSPSPSASALKTQSHVPSAKVPPTSKLNHAQLAMLKSQIVAYNCLNSPNGQVPPAVQQAIFGRVYGASNEVSPSMPFQQNVPQMSSVKKDTPTRDANMRTSKAPYIQNIPNQFQRRAYSAAIPVKNESLAKPSVSPMPLQQSTEKTEVAKRAQFPTKVNYSSCVDPRTYVKTPIPFSKFSSSENLSLIPSLLPPSISWDDIFLSSEIAIACSIANRIDFLEKENRPKSVNEKILQQDKSKTMIELRCLRLLEKQRSLRETINSVIPHSDSLAAGNLRLMFRNVKRQTMQEANLVLALAEKQKTEHAMRQKEKLLTHLRSIMLHRKSIVTKVDKQNKAKTQRCKDIINFHAHLEKEEKKRIERSARQRLQALRADDEAAYLQLLDKAKDTRITHLLKQTDQYLENLTRAVRIQQSNIHSGNTSGKGSNSAELEAPISEEDKNLDYFKVAHRIHEEVEQPKIFVGGTLKDYQLKGLEWMLSLYNNNLNGILADEMGLGKTIQTIAFITYLIEKKNQQGPFLIIVPLSTLTNWIMEFEKWAPSVKKIAYKGPPQLRKTLQSQIRSSNFNVLLTTFEYIIKDRPLLSRIKWVHMIIDEGHRIKNTQSKLTSTLSTYYHSQYRLILTGTPLQNNLPELWALLNFVLPKIFNSIKSFDEWFNTPFANTGGQDKIGLNEEEALLIIKRLHKVLRPFLFRRLKKDVEKELPDKVEKVIKCPLSGLQLKLYQQMKKHGMLFVDGEKGKTGIKGLQNTVMQLKKICNHPFIFEDVERAIDPSGTNVDLLWRAAGKFELLDRILPKLFLTGHKTLMFFQMTQIMTIMEDYLRSKNWKYLRLDGSTKSDDRCSLLAQFNDPKSDVYIFMLSTRAGGLGLNLQTADTVIIFDTDWNPHQDLQAQDRAHRIGQTKEVRILRLITEKSIEENILSRAQYKLDLDGKVIQAGKFDNKSTPEEREAFLRSLLEHDGDDDHDLTYGELQDDELNELISRTDEELVLFKKLDKERAATDIYGKGKPLERLLTVNELPDFYKVEVDSFAVQSSSELEDQYLERKRRRRNSISYTELTLDELNTVDDPSSTLMPRKRGRPRKKTNSGSSLSTPLSQESSLARSGRKNTPSYKQKALRRYCMEIFERLYNLQSEDGRFVNGLFLYPPNRKLYPDYYIIIKRPIALGKIKRNIKNDRYGDVGELIADFMLMFNNAYTYNEEHSIVYEDAKLMEKTLKEVIEDLEKNNSLHAYEEEALNEEQASLVFLENSEAELPLDSGIVSAEDDKVITYEDSSSSYSE